MSLTNTNREARRSERSVGLRDLRFAGTVAAGLVAGVLGVGALSAPLLGWTDWPDQLQPGGGNAAVTMRSPQLRQDIAQPPRTGSGPPPAGPSAIPGAGTVTALVITPRTGTTVSGNAGTGNGGTPASPQSQPVGSSVQGDGSGTNFGGTGFVTPTNTADSDGDAMPDAWENTYGGNLD